MLQIGLECPSFCNLVQVVNLSIGKIYLEVAQQRTKCDMTEDELQSAQKAQRVVWGDYNILCFD